MANPHLGDSYDFPSNNRVEGYGGDINFYIQWEQHLLFACPSAYRAPLNMKFGDFLEQMWRPDFHAHPDTEKLDFSTLVWQFNQQPWEADLDKTIEENGIGHMDYLQFKSPGLEGMHGVGN